MGVGERVMAWLSGHRRAVSGVAGRLVALFVLAVAILATITALSSSVEAQSSGNIWLDGPLVPGGTMTIHTPDFCPYQAPPTPTQPPDYPGSGGTVPPPSPPVVGALPPGTAACAPGGGSTGVGGGHG